MHLFPLNLLIKERKFLGVVQARNQGGRGSPQPFFENRKKCPYFGKKDPDCVHLRVIFAIQNVVFRGSRRKKTSKFFLAGSFFLVFQRNVYQKSLIPLNLPCPEKFLVALLQKQQFQLKENVQFITGQPIVTPNPDIRTTLCRFGVKVS